jgi:hypothetical protein
MLKYGVADNEYKQTSLSFWVRGRRALTQP